jgi:hypothetical protein
MTPRKAVGLAALLLLSCAPGPWAEAEGAKKKSGPLLLLHDWFGSSPAATPTFVRDNLEFLESQPFDGLALYLRTPDLKTNVTAKVLSDSRLSLEQIQEVLRPLASVRFRTLLHNFAAVLSQNPPDVFDDWEGVLQNFGNLARAAREARLEGVYLDNENYGTHWTDYPSGVAYPKRSLQEYQDQARLRGRQVMKAMAAVYPELTVIVLHGPYVSESKAPHPLFPSWEHANRLQGPFFSGLVEGAGPASRCVDGGELYHLRSAEDFQRSYEWRKSSLASDRVNCAYLPPAVRARWPATVEIAFGLYDRPFGGAPMDPPALRSCVRLALSRTDRYVWLYVEGPTFLRPPDRGGAPAEWVDAVRQGRADALAQRR